MVVHYQLCPTVVENLLTYEGATLIAGLMVGYDIDFASVSKYELNKIEFSNMATLPFPFLI